MALCFRVGVAEVLCHASWMDARALNWRKARASARLAVDVVNKHWLGHYHTMCYEYDGLVLAC